MPKRRSELHRSQPAQSTPEEGSVHLVPNTTMLCICNGSLHTPKNWRSFDQLNAQLAELRAELALAYELNEQHEAALKQAQARIARYEGVECCCNRPHMHRGVDFDGPRCDQCPVHALEPKGE